MSVPLLKALVATADALPPPIATWLVAGYARYMAGESLESALDTAAKPGQRKPSTQLRIARRDAELCEAWRLTAGDKPWCKSVNLATAISRLSPIHRAFLAGRMPESPRNAALCRARQYGPLPTKPRRIHTICSPQ